eukprot:17769-Heterococcus_DN1.PRE.2
MFNSRIPQVLATQSCTSPANGGCQNGSTCTLNDKGLIWCKNCPSSYTGYRCEIPAGSRAGNQNCANPESGPCKNGSSCTITNEGWIYCTGCPKGYSGNRCEIAPAGGSTSTAGKQNCANPESGPCQNGSECTINHEGYIWCKNCPAGYSGYRCEKPPAGTGTATTAATPQTCNPPTDGPCQNGSQCTLNSAGFIWCKGLVENYHL